jgi:DNA modification methylase
MKNKSNRIDPKNKLNNLTGKEWIKFTKSWFIEDGKPSEITKDIELHPASFPPPMIRDFIRFFTKKGEWVLDPFVGTGSTLVACDETGRKGVGIELYQKYANSAKKRTNLEVYIGDTAKIIRDLVKENYKFQLCITSPPYWHILKKTKDYNQQERSKKGLDLKYGENEADLGLISNYDDFIKKLVFIFKEIKSLLTSNGHLVIITQNIRHERNNYPIAFDLTSHLNQLYSYQGEKIWCQNQKVLRPYGYPYAFVPNVHHHYCLIFKNTEKID